MYFRSTITLTLPFFLLLTSFFIVSIHGQSTSSSIFSHVNGTSFQSSNPSVSPTSSAAYPSLSGYSPCVTNCLQLAASNGGCSSIIQTSCYCNSTNVTPFERDLVSCVGSGCPNELSSAESLAKAFCAAGNSSTSISFPPMTSSSSSRSSSLSSVSSSIHSSSSTSSSSSSPTRSSNSAVDAHGELHGITFTLLFGICVGLASVLMGAFSV